MATIAERRKIAKLVLTTTDDNVIRKISTMISDKAKELKHYNKELNEAVARIRKGSYYTQEQAENMLAKWEKE